MTFKEYSASSRELIKNNLSEFCKSKREENLPSIFKEQGLIDALEDFVLRGKLIRGTLFLLMVEALGEQIDKKHLDIACAIELMHSALLVQDDIIDKDEVRRGARTIFSHYQKEGEEISAYDPYHYGVSTAIVVADVAFFMAIELISNYKDHSLAKLLKYYAHEVYLVSLAESADSLFGQTNKEPLKEDIYALYKYKTARYTFSLPFEMAAIVTNVSDSTRQKLSALGEAAGIIFQLKDDELGLFGTEDMIGKVVGSDVRENKKTLIRSLLYEKADEQDRKTLDFCFGNPQSGEIEVNKIRDLYNKYGIKNIIDSEINKIMDKGWEIFEDIEIKNEFKILIKDLLEFNLSRSV